MSHGLVIDRQGRASFCYNHRNGNPWHRFGDPFNGAYSLDQAATASGFDREARLAPIMVDGPYGLMEMPSRQAVLFPDEDGMYQPFEVVSDDYRLVQYRALAEIALAIVGADHTHAVLDTMGLLFEGRRGFGFIDFGDVPLVLPNGAVDMMFKGLGFLGSVDGSMASTFYKSNMRAVCNNTVTAGIEMAQHIIRIRHTGDQEAKMRDVRNILEMERKAEDAFEAVVMKLGSVRGGDDVLDKVIDRLWPAPPPAEETTVTRRIRVKRREKIHALYAGPANAGGFGPHGWSVFNAVGEFLDHHHGVDADARAWGSINPSSTKQTKKEQAVKVLLSV